MGMVDTDSHTVPIVIGMLFFVVGIATHTSSNASDVVTYGFFVAGFLVLIASLVQT